MDCKPKTKPGPFGHPITVEYQQHTTIYQNLERHLMLSRNFVARELFHSFLGNITQSNHANRLPNAETNPGGNAAVQSFQTVVLINVLGRLCNGQVLGAVGIYRLGLHLNTDDLDGLIPSAETTTQSRCNDLLHDTELLTILLAGDLADTRLGDTGQTKARAPVGDLADRDGVHTAVDTANTFLSPDVHERLHGAWGLHPGSRDLVLCDLDGLHASAETHGGIGLREASNHTARDTGDEVGGTEGLGIELGLGRNEEEDGSFGGGFDPGPGNETLVESQHTTTTPNTADSTTETLATVGGHGRLDHFKRLSQSCDFKQVQASSEKKVGELDRLLLEFGWSSWDASWGNGSSAHLWDCIVDERGRTKAGGRVVRWKGR